MTEEHNEIDALRNAFRIACQEVEKLNAQLIAVSEELGRYVEANQALALKLEDAEEIIKDFRHKEQLEEAAIKAMGRMAEPGPDWEPGDAIVENGMITVYDKSGAPRVCLPEDDYHKIRGGK